MGFFKRLSTSRQNFGVTIVILGAVCTKISINAALGDDSSYGQMHPFQEKGMKKMQQKYSGCYRPRAGRGNCCTMEIPLACFSSSIFPNRAAHTIRHTPDNKH